MNTENTAPTDTTENTADTTDTAETLVIIPDALRKDVEDRLYEHYGKYSARFIAAWGEFAKAVYAGKAYESLPEDMREEFTLRIDETNLQQFFAAYVGDDGHRLIDYAYQQGVNKGYVDPYGAIDHRNTAEMETYAAQIESRCVIGEADYINEYGEEVHSTPIFDFQAVLALPE